MSGSGLWQWECPGALVVLVLWACVGVFELSEDYSDWKAFLFSVVCVFASLVRLFRMFSVCRGDTVTVSSLTPLIGSSLQGG